jgi:hypothetical protein
MDQKTLNMDKREAWVSCLRWTKTVSGNLRRLIETPNHAFIVVRERENSFRAMYKYGDEPWVTINYCPTLREAKIALLPCAREAEVAWH